MSTDIAKSPVKLSEQTLESLVLRGDISGLSAPQRVEYYNALCNRVGLDPATQPFKIMTLNGKQLLYADKGCAEQLRKRHKISVTIVSRERIDDVYVVTAQATGADGRMDESIGAVSCGAAKGEAFANVLMKAETKAKRRVTLSIVGLGMLDESEVDGLDNSFGSIPPEPTKLDQARVVHIAAQAKSALREQQSDGLSEPWDITKPIPAGLQQWWKPLQKVGDRALGELSIDELDMVKEQCAAAFARAEQKPNSTRRQLDLINEIGAAANELLQATRGDA